MFTHECIVAETSILGKLPNDDRESSFPTWRKANHPCVHTREKGIYSIFTHVLVADLLKLLEIISFVTKSTIPKAKTRVSIILTETYIL